MNTEWCPVCHTYHVNPGGKTDAGRLTRACPLLASDENVDDDGLCPHGWPYEFCGNCHEDENDSAHETPDMRFLTDPGVVADVEVAVEVQMRDHQETDGSYSCDPHVMVSYVLEALRNARYGAHDV